MKIVMPATRVKVARLNRLEVRTVTTIPSSLVVISMRQPRRDLCAALEAVEGAVGDVADHADRRIAR